VSLCVLHVKMISANPSIFSYINIQRDRTIVFGSSYFEGGLMKKLSFVLFIFLCTSIVSATISQSLPFRDVIVSNHNGVAEFSNCEVYGEPGRPLLPSKRYFFLVPPDADLSRCSFSIKGLKEKTLDGVFTVAPAQPGYTRNGPVWPEKRNIVDGKDVAVYSNNAFFPGSYIQDVKAEQMRCFKIVQVRVYLSQFNPVSGTLKTMTQGELVLNIGGKTRVHGTQYPVPAKFQKLARNLVVNYDAVAPLYNELFSFTRKTTYLIMTEESIKSNSSKFADLVESKKGRGFEVKVLTESDWGGGTGDAAAENMREWMIENYEDENIEYLLLIGSSMPTSGKVPMKTTKGNMDLETDWYYQALTGSWTDKPTLAEVSAGRIPVYDDDISALDDILEKIITYENTPVEGIEWRFNALFAEKPFDSETPGSKMFEQLKADVIDEQGWDCYRIYDDNVGNPDESSCSQNAVTSAWKADQYGLVQWMTHGSSTGASSIMSSTATSNLGSNDHPPFVVMGSCSNGTITKSNNLAFSMLKNASIMSLGATEVTLYDVGNKSSFENSNYIQGINYQFGKGIVLDSLGAGDAHDQIISNSTNLKWHNALAYTVFGCPDVGVYTCKNPTAVQDMVVPEKSGADYLSVNTIDKRSNRYQVTYTVSGTERVLLNVFDMQGKIVRKLVDKVQQENRYSILFTTQDLAKGVYFCTLLSGGRKVATRKITVIY